MAFQQYFVQEWNPIPTSASYSEKASACFDCNICLDLARDPVVTLCGHLYCWPCIHKWIDTQSASLSSAQLPQCPVCKAETSVKTMVPLYGRGQSLSDPEHEVNEVVPPRPPACGIRGLTDMFNLEGQLPSRDYHPNLHNRYNNYEGDSEPQLSNIRGIALSHPTVGMLGEMVYAGVFGNSASLYAYPNSYHSAGSNTPRLRRRELQADRSLNRVTLFLFCCLLACLLLF